MILQALYEYYRRKAAEPESRIAPAGWEWKGIPFLIVIDPTGKFSHLEDTREPERGTLRPRMFLIPKAVSRTGSKAYQSANLLWDHYGYVLGHPRGEGKPHKLMAARQLASFTEKLRGLPDEVRSATAVRAVLRFYEREEYTRVFEDAKWEDCQRITGCNLTFKLSSSDAPVTEAEEVKTAVGSLVPMDAESDTDGEKTAIDGICLITGEKARIARTHTRTPIDKDTKALVAFQRNSGYDSYGKTQAFNAPVGVAAESAYTTALNHLLRRDSPNRLRMGDLTLVFWAERKQEGYDLESDFMWLLSDPPRDDPDRGVRAVKALYRAAESGSLPASDGSKFYVLGLSGNAARIAVRLWRTATVRDLAEKIKLHFDDLEITKGPADPDSLSLGQLLNATALQYKSENVPPSLAPAVVSSILDGTPYPRTLLQQCMRRIRAERKVTRTRAAILKAFLNRARRFYDQREEEIAMGLDRANASPGYRLGRLFAVLDKIQEEASPGINATIRDRFYGAASSTPVSVFSQLLKLKNHHLAKLGEGRKVFMEKEIGEILSGLRDFPAHMSMDEQARFAIGYYHQRQSFFEKKEVSA